MTRIVRNSAGYNLHKIATVWRPNHDGGQVSCHVCGWSRTAADKAQAHALRERHAQRPREWPTFHCGMVSSAGQDLADNHAVVIGVSDDIPTSAWALASNLSTAASSDLPQRLAHEAVSAIMNKRIDVVEAVLDARDSMNGADAALIVVATTPAPFANGYDIAAVGDYHAYYQRGDGIAALPSASEAAGPDSGYAALVTEPGERITRARTTTARGRLLVVSGSVVRAVPESDLVTAVTAQRSPQTRAHNVFHAATRAGVGAGMAVLALDPLSTE